MTLLALVDELQALTSRLRVAVIEGDDGGDQDWHVREVTQRMYAVLQILEHRVMCDALHDVAHARRFLDRALAGEPAAEILQLLGDDPARVTLVSQIVFELVGSMTARGAVLWFDAPSPQLSGRTPRELLDESLAIHRSSLLATAGGQRAAVRRR